MPKEGAVRERQHAGVEALGKAFLLTVCLFVCSRSDSTSSFHGSYHVQLLGECETSNHLPGGESSYPASQKMTDDLNLETHPIKPLPLTVLFFVWLVIFETKSPGWLQPSFAADNNLELLNPPVTISQVLGSRQAPLCPVYPVLGLEPRTSYMLGWHSAL